MHQQIVSFGEALVDVLPSGEVVGGAPLNVATRAAELCSLTDARTALVTRIGSEHRGETILEQLKQVAASHPLDLSTVQVDPHLETGFVNVELNDGQPEYSIGEHVAWDNIRWDDSIAKLATMTNVLSFGSLALRSATTRETLLQLASHLPGAQLVFDINLRNPLPDQETVLQSLSICHILKCNEDELQVLADWLEFSESDATEIAHVLQERFGLQAVFWTRGSDGCQWQVGRDVIHGEVPQLTASENADSVGAGDAASAALLVGLVAGWSPKQIIDIANLCGAHAATTRGPTVPISGEVIARIKTLLHK